MTFTREDILKIQNALLQLGRKDSEFKDADTPLNSNDYIAILQDGINKKVSINNLLSTLGLLKKDDFINVSDRYDEYYLQLSEAITLIANNKRKKGLVITFQDLQGNWKIFQFNGELNNFINTNYWKDLFDFKYPIINTILPDEEDLTLTYPNIEGNSFIKLKDKEYNSRDFSGLGRIILRKNLVNEVNTLTQAMVNKSDTIYIIQYDFTLNENITIPANCILKFEGGSLSGAYTITGNNTRIEAGSITIFGLDIMLAGKWIVNEGWNICWFGAKGDGVTDNSQVFNRAFFVVNSLYPSISQGYAYNYGTIYIPGGEFALTSCKIQNRFNIKGSGSNSIIKSLGNYILFEINGDTIVASILDLTFLANELSTSVAISNMSTAFNSLVQISRVNFINFGIALNFYKPYWTRITECNFTYNTVAIEATNANDFSIVNCNFRAFDASPGPYHIKLNNSLQGFNINGCDFSGSYESSIILDNIQAIGVNITGNYFEPGIDITYTIPTIKAINNCYLSGFVYKGNLAYERNSFDPYDSNNEPRNYIYLESAYIFYSDICGILITGSNTISGSGSIGQLQIYKLSDFINNDVNALTQLPIAIKEYLDNGKSEEYATIVKNLDTVVRNILKNKELSMTNIVNRIAEYSFPLILDKGSSRIFVDIGNKTYTSEFRPKIVERGYMYYDTTLAKPIFKGADRWNEADGTQAGVKRKDTVRPSVSQIPIGFMFIDESLSPARPIYWTGDTSNSKSGWIDATGTPV